jgi:hypothetical protein
MHEGSRLARYLFGFPMRVLRPLKGFVGMFQSLSGVLVSSLMIFFSVVSGGGAVRVCGELVVLGGSLVRVIWHEVQVLTA